MRQRNGLTALVAGLAALVGLVQPASAGLVKAIEYAGDHVFLTANPGEIAALDSGTIPGWQRTGVELWVHDTPEPGLVPVCRFYSAAFAPRSSHFYTADPAECASVQGSHDWVYEGVAFYASPSGADGQCPADWWGVARWYNNGRGGAPIHVYVPEVLYYNWDYAEIPPAGWTVELDWYIGRGRYAYCTQAGLYSGQDRTRRQQGLRALFLGATWRLVLDRGGPNESTVEVFFPSSEWRVAHLRVSSTSIRPQDKYFWDLRESGRSIDVTTLEPLRFVTGRGEVVLASLNLQYLGSERVEGTACIAIDAGNPNPDRKCDMTVDGHRE